MRKNFEESFQKAANDEKELRDRINSLRNTTKINNIAIITSTFGLACLLGTILVSLFINNKFSAVISFLLIVFDAIYYLIVSKKQEKSKRELFELELMIKDVEEEKNDAFSVLKNSPRMAFNESKFNDSKLIK